MIVHEEIIFSYPDSLFKHDFLMSSKGSIRTRGERASSRSESRHRELLSSHHQSIRRASTTTQPSSSMAPSMYDPTYTLPVRSESSQPAHATDTPWSSTASAAPPFGPTSEEPWQSTTASSDFWLYPSPMQFDDSSQYASVGSGSFHEHGSSMVNPHLDTGAQTMRPPDLLFVTQDAEMYTGMGRGIQTYADSSFSNISGYSDPLRPVPASVPVSTPSFVFNHVAGAPQAPPNHAWNFQSDQRNSVTPLHVPRLSPHSLIDVNDGGTEQSVSRQNSNRKSTNTSHQCPHCPVIIGTSYNLRAHIRNKHGDPPAKLYECDWPNCTRRFARFADLKRHHDGVSWCFSPNRWYDN